MIKSQIDKIINRLKIKYNYLTSILLYSNVYYHFNNNKNVEYFSYIGIIIFIYQNLYNAKLLAIT